MDKPRGIVSPRTYCEAKASVSCLLARSVRLLRARRTTSGNASYRALIADVRTAQMWGYRR